MKLKNAVFILMTAGLTFSLAAEPEPKSGPAAAAPDAEISAKLDNTLTLLTVLLLDIENAGLPELQMKLQTLKAVEKELGEENLMRLEIIEEFDKTRYGIHALSLSQKKDWGKEQKLAALEKITKILSDPANEPGDLRSAKTSLNAFRAALSAFHAEKNVFPEKAEELVDKYLPRIPDIRLPGHSISTNSVQVLKEVKDIEDLYQKVGDSGGWLYVGDKTSPIWGTVILDCNHKGYSGAAMFRY